MFGFGGEGTLFLWQHQGWCQGLLLRSWCGCTMTIPDGCEPDVCQEPKYECHRHWVCAVFGNFSHVRLFATLWARVCQAPLSVGFSRQEYWNGFPCLPPGNLPDPGIKPTSLTSPALAGRFFNTSATWMPWWLGGKESTCSAGSNLILGWEDPLKKEISTHSWAWQAIQSMGSQESDTT